MALSIADYLLQLPENMNFAKVQELSGEDSLYYRMLSDYGSGSFQLIRFENDLLMILIADYTPKETFEKIATISEEYMEISQFETDSSSFKIGRRKTQPVGKGIYCYVNTQKTTYVYCEKGKPVRFTKIILTRKYFDTYSVNFFVCSKVIVSFHPHSFFYSTALFVKYILIFCSYIPFLISSINVISAGNHSTSFSFSFVNHFAASCSFNTRSPFKTSHQKQSIER